MLPNIYMIAEKAGVSPSTVSNIFNNRKGRYGPDTAVKVLKIAEELGYEPDARASGLAMKRSYNIGLVYYRTFEQVSNIFYSKITEGIVTEISRLRYKVIFTMIPEDGRLPSLVRKKDTDGLIIVNTIPHETVLKLTELRLPSVLLLPLKEENIRMDFISIDNASGIRKVMEYLAGLGHERIGLITQRGFVQDFKEREEAFFKAAEEKGLKVSEAHVRCPVQKPWELGSLVDFGESMAVDMVAKGDLPSAVVCVSDEIALGAIQGFHARGVRVPEDISVTGFDDIGWAQFFIPRLTTLRTPRTELGVKAVELLMERIANPVMAHVSKILDVDLIVRDSCARK
jgi:DNA-binding LacI/PurR family transcriptional regulator